MSCTQIVWYKLKLANDGIFYNFANYSYKKKRKKNKLMICVKKFYLSHSLYLLQVSLDSRVREIVNRNMVEPTPHTFDDAQLQIYTLMHRDSYPRFVNSEIYRRVARLNSSSPPSPSTGQEHGSGKTKGKRGAT